MTTNDPTTKLIERAAGEIRDTDLDEASVRAATDRVWAALRREFAIDQPLRSCADIQALLPAYAAGELAKAKAMLIGDHTRECVPCRRALLEVRGGGRKTTPGPTATIPTGIPRWLKLAAAAVMVICGGSLTYITSSNLIADRTFTAQVASTAGSLQLVTDDSTTMLAEGDRFGTRQRLRTAKDAGAFLRLADGSVIEMAPRSELELRASRLGTRVDLSRGNIIVHAADQGRGQLAVRTDECEVAVKGTIFAVNHGLKGSRVSVIEGAVEVRQAGAHAMLHPGDQLTTDQRLRPVSIADEIAWSANADEHLELLTALTQLQHRVAEAVDVAHPRTSTRLLRLVPADTVLYIAMPNLTEGLGAARRVFDSGLADSEVLRDWWQREIVANGIDTQIEDSLDRLQFLGEAVGEEVVVALPSSALEAEGAPVILAELVDPQGFRALLEAELGAHSATPVVVLDNPDQPIKGDAELVIWVADDLVAAAPDAALIRSIAASVAGTGTDRFADTELHQRLAERYAGGVEWLLGLDLRRMLHKAAGASSPDDAALMQGFGLLDATTLVFERRRTTTGSEIDVEVRFDGPRHGLAAWLADPAPLATLDFISADAALVTAVAAKDGVELFDELLEMVATSGPEALAELRNFEDSIGIDLRNDLAAAIGGEGTFAVDGPVLPIPTWKLIAEVYDPETLDHAIDLMVDLANTELAANGAELITVEKISAAGLELVSISHPSNPIPFTYTLTDGFLIAGSSPAAIERALQIRAAGTGLTRSTVFRELLPDNGFTDCSALVYRNLAPIFGALPPGAMGPELGAYEGLLRESSAPGLFCVYGLADRILVSGSGPSLTALAPLLGMHGLLAVDEITQQVHPDGPGEPLSSQS
jgi:hypothetical protein